MTKLRKQRTRLWEEDPHCRNCGVLTILPHDVPGYQPESKFVSPDNMATIQHVYSRLNPERRQINGTRGNQPEPRHLLWCFKCNQEDCKKEMDELGIEELRKRAMNGHHKKNIII